MYRCALSSLVIALTISPLASIAADGFDPAARAAAVAPLVGPGVSVVVHVDVARIQLEPVFAMAVKITGEAGALGPEKVKAQAALAAFAATGAQELYLIVSADSLPPRPPLLAVPSSPKLNADALALLLGAGNSLAHAPVGDLVVFADKDRLAALTQRNARAGDDLAAGLAAVGDAAVQAVVLLSDDSRRALRETLPELPPEAGGGPAAPLVDGVRWAALAVDIAPKFSLHLVVASPSEDAAKALHAAAPQVIEALRRHPEIARVLPLEKARGLFQVERKGQVTHVRLNEDASGTFLTSVLEPPVAAARQAARRAQALNSIKQIGIAMHNYHDVHKSLPPAYTANDGKPLLSWRVHILPYLEQEPLYREFHLDEPWDSEHNKKLIPRMPSTYALPGSKAAAEGRTAFVTPRGEQTAFPGATGVSVKAITDGTSRTIMLLECDELHAPIWTKPDDWQPDDANPLSGLGGHFDNVFLVGMCDASARAVANNVDAAVFRAVLTRNGSEAAQMQWP